MTSKRKSEGMPQVCWSADVGGRYWIDILLDAHPLKFMLDLGLVGPAGQVGLVLDPTEYGLLKSSGSLTHFTTRFHNDATGHITSSESGLISASLWNLRVQRAVGPKVSTWVA